MKKRHTRVQLHSPKPNRILQGAKSHTLHTRSSPFPVSPYHFPILLFFLSSIISHTYDENSQCNKITVVSHVFHPSPHHPCWMFRSRSFVGPWRPKRKNCSVSPHSAIDASKKTVDGDGVRVEGGG